MVIAAVDDLFFAAKIRATGDAAGVPVRIAKNREAAMRMAHEETAALIVIDLHCRSCEPFELARELKQDERLRNVPLIGFFSHVQTKLKQQAKEAGFDQVLARSVFSKRLEEILKGEFKLLS